MSYNDTQYIPSTTPGMTWSIATYKPQGRPGYAVASEGVREEGIDGGFSSFTVRMFQDRVKREPVEGRMTVKSRNAALVRLFNRLREEKMIPEDATLRAVL